MAMALLAEALLCMPLRAARLGQENRAPAEEPREVARV
jgi:hypothetical protein